MLQSEHRGIEVDGPAVLLGVDEGLARRIAHADGSLRIADGAEVVGAQGLEGDVTYGLHLLRLGLGKELEAPLLLEVEVDGLTVVHEHLVYLCHLERREHVVLVRLDELVGRQGHIAHGLEGDGLFRELARQVAGFVEGVDELGIIVCLLGLESTGQVALQEDVGMQVGRCLCTGTQTHLVVKVLRDDGVHRSYVHLAGMLLRACLHEVLYQGFQSEDDVLEALHLLQLTDEDVDGALALGQLHLPVFLPELVTLHLSIGILQHLLLSLQQRLGYLVEGEVGTAGSPDDDELLDELGSNELNEHIVDREHPFTGVQLRELLQALHVLHPVHVTGVGDGQFAAFHLVRRVGHDVQLTAEAEVLLIVGREVQVYAAVVAHEDGVLYVVAVELYGILADRTGERILEQAYVVLVDVDVGKHVAQDGGQDVTRLKQVVDTHRVLSLDDALLCMGVFAVQLLTDRLINGDWQHQFIIILAHLHLVEQPLALLEDTLLQALGGQVVETQHQLLVVIVLIVVLVLQVGLLLRCHHLLHQLHGGIVLTAVARRAL